MLIVKTLPEFETWLTNLPDKVVRRAISARLNRLTHGLFGDVKFSVAPQVHELRINVGAGWRVYFTQREEKIVVVLAGGSKRTQTQDIKAAAQMVKNLGEIGESHGKLH